MIINYFPRLSEIRLKWENELELVYLQSKFNFDSPDEYGHDIEVKTRNGEISIRIAGKKWNTP